MFWKETLSLVGGSELVFSKYLGDYSELAFRDLPKEKALQLQFLVFYENAVTGNNSPHKFSRIFCNFSYVI